MVAHLNYTDTQPCSHETTRPLPLKLHGTPGIVELMVRVEQQRPRSAADLRKSSSTCRKNNDTTEQYDFRQRSASRFQFARQPNCLGRFVVHALQGTRKRQVR